LLFEGIACCCQDSGLERRKKGGEERVVVRWIIVILSRFILFNENPANNNPFPLPSSLFPLPLRLCASAHLREIFSDKRLCERGI